MLKMEEWLKVLTLLNLKDAGDPVEQAKIYSDGGADEICFLDITASNENRKTIYDVVKRNIKKMFCSVNSWWWR